MAKKIKIEFSSNTVKIVFGFALSVLVSIFFIETDILQEIRYECIPLLVLFLSVVFLGTFIFFMPLFWLVRWIYFSFKYCRSLSQWISAILISLIAPIMLIYIWIYGVSITQIINREVNTIYNIDEFFQPEKRFSYSVAARFVFGPPSSSRGDGFQVACSFKLDSSSPNFNYAYGLIGNAPSVILNKNELFNLINSAAFQHQATHRYRWSVGYSESKAKFIEKINNMFHPFYSDFKCFLKRDKNSHYILVTGNKISRSLILEIVYFLVIISFLGWLVAYEMHYLRLCLLGRTDELEKL